MFDHIPVGVGSKGIIPMNARDLEEALEMGMDWSLREGKDNSLLLFSFFMCSDSISIYICFKLDDSCILMFERLHLGRR